MTRAAPLRRRPGRALPATPRAVHEPLSPSPLARARRHRRPPRRGSVGRAVRRARPHGGQPLPARRGRQRGGPRALRPPGRPSARDRDRRRARGAAHRARPRVADGGLARRRGGPRPPGAAADARGHPRVELRDPLAGAPLAPCSARRLPGQVHARGRADRVRRSHRGSRGPRLPPSSAAPTEARDGPPDASHRSGSSRSSASTPRSSNARGESAHRWLDDLVERASEELAGADPADCSPSWTPGSPTSAPRSTTRDARATTSG